MKAQCTTRAADVDLAALPDPSTEARHNGNAEAGRMQREADRCREMANYMLHARTRALLERIARDFDDEADKLEQPG